MKGDDGGQFYPIDAVPSTFFAITLKSADLSAYSSVLADVQGIGKQGKDFINLSTVVWTEGKTYNLGQVYLAVYQHTPGDVDEWGHLSSFSSTSIPKAYGLKRSFVNVKDITTFTPEPTLTVQTLKSTIHWAWGEHLKLMIDQKAKFDEAQKRSAALEEKLKKMNPGSSSESGGSINSGGSIGGGTNPQLGGEIPHSLSADTSWPTPLSVSGTNLAKASETKIDSFKNYVVDINGSTIQNGSVDKMGGQDNKSYSIVGGAIISPAPQAVSLSQNDLPLSYSLKDLPSDFHSVDLKIPSQVFENYILTMGMSQLLPGFAFMDTFWTNNKTVSVDGEIYMVFYKYRLDSSVGSQMMNGRMQPKPEMPKDLILYQNLIKLSTIELIAPRPDLTPAAYENLQKSPNSAYGFGGSQGSVQAKKTEEISNIKQICLGALMYSTDFNDFYPEANDSNSFEKKVMPYLKNARLFTTQNPRGGRILFNTHLSHVNATQIPAPADMPLVYDSEAWPDGGRAVGFTDGHVKYLSASDWAKTSKQLAKRFGPYHK